MKPVNLLYLPRLADSCGLPAVLCLSTVYHFYKTQPKYEWTPDDPSIPYWVEELEAHGVFRIPCHEVDSTALNFPRYAKRLMAWHRNFEAFKAAEHKFDENQKPFSIIYSRYARSYFVLPNLPSLKSVIDDDKATGKKASSYNDFHF